VIVSSAKIVADHLEVEMQMKLIDLWLILGGLVGTIGFLSYTFREWILLHRLNEIGLPVDAQIVDLGTNSIGRNYYFYVEYKFTVISDADFLPEQHQRQQAITRKHFERLKKSTHVTVKYMPTAPAISRLVDLDADTTGRNMALLRGMIIFAVWLTLLANRSG
jgi:hypothetical protein